MRLSERVVFTGLSLAALLLAGYAIVRPGGSAAFATPAFMPAPAASIATFDVYRAADLMMKSEQLSVVGDTNLTILCEPCLTNEPRSLSG